MNDTAMGKEPLDAPFKTHVQAVIQGEYKYYPAGPNHRLRVLWCFIVVATEMLALEAGSAAVLAALNGVIARIGGGR
jgi:hypothetical protein